MYAHIGAYFTPCLILILENSRAIEAPCRTYPLTLFSTAFNLQVN